MIRNWHVLLLSLGRYLCWWTISPRGHHPSSSQCFGTGMFYYQHWVDTSASGLLVPEDIIRPVVNASHWHVLLLALGRYLCWWTISLRGHHPSSSQCFGIGMFYYQHWVDTSASGLLVPEDIIRPVVNAAALACFITSTGSIPLLVDYQSPRTSSVQQSMLLHGHILLLSLGRYLCWWTISPRGHHLSSSQCFGTGILYYQHWVDTSASGLLVPEDIIHPVVNASALACCITITGSITLLEDYQSSRTSSVQQSMLRHWHVLLLALGRYLCQWTISPRGHHPSSSQCFGTGMLYYYHWIDTSAGGLLFPEDIIRPVVNASALACFITITGSIPLLVDYQSSRTPSVQQSILRHWHVVLLSLGRYLCWWTISPRGHHPSSSQCFGTGMFYYYHWVDTSASGLLVPKDIIRPVVNASALACCITITGSITLLVDYQSPRTSSVQQSMLRHWHVLLLSLGRYLCWWTISPRGHHSSSSQCFGTGMFYYYHWVDTSAGGLLVPEDIIRPVVNASALACFITIIGSIPLLVDYQSSRTSSVQQSMLRHWHVVLLSLGRYLCWWTISPRGHHPSSSQCFSTGMFYYYHWVDTSASGLLVLEDIILPVVNASALACCITITGSIPLLVDYQSPRTSSTQQSMLRHWHILLLSLGRYLCQWTISPRGHHLSSSQCFGTGMLYYYHWVDTSASGLLVPEDIIRPVVNASALACYISSTGSIPLLVDYQSSRTPSVQQSMLRHWHVLLLSLGRYLCWWTISPRGHHPSSSQCFGTGMFYYYHWVDTSAGGLLVSEDIIRPVVNASALACFITSTGSIPLLVDYQSPRTSSVQQSMLRHWHVVLLSLGR